MVSLVVSS